jgi:hypothetical protein
LSCGRAEDWMVLDGERGVEGNKNQCWRVKR